MQAEDIIREKDWHQLNTEERTLLEPLASTEQEFNLLKKMLFVAAEEAVTIPQVDPSIQQKLHGSLRTKPVRFAIRRWHYAAAAVVLVALSTWLFIQNDRTQPAFVKKSEQDVRKKDSMMPAPPSIIDKIENNYPDPAIVKKENAPAKSPPVRNQPTPPQQAPIPAHIDTKEPPAAEIAMNARISDNASLLTLVTEVYE